MSPRRDNALKVSASLPRIIASTAPQSWTAASAIAASTAWTKEHLGTIGPGSLISSRQTKLEHPRIVSRHYRARIFSKTGREDHWQLYPGTFGPGSFCLFGFFLRKTIDNWIQALSGPGSFVKADSRRREWNPGTTWAKIFVYFLFSQTGN